MKGRQAVVEQQMVHLFNNTIPGFNYSLPVPPTIGIAISGGGYRSMLTGSGVLAAFDARTPGFAGLKHLLQSTSYIAGISGGSWLVMSNFVNDFKPFHEVWFDDSTWSLQHQLIEGVPSFDPDKLRGQISEPETADTPERSGIIDVILNFFGLGVSKVDQSQNFLKSLIKPMILITNSSENDGTLKEVFGFFKNLQIEVRTKKEAGFLISFTDYLGRALSRKIFPAHARAPGTTVTSSTYLPSFLHHQQPYPIICSVEKALTGTRMSNIFELSPYEFGSWDPSLNAFTLMKYMGLVLHDGKSVFHTENSKYAICTSGFDNVGFVTGTSSSLFNQVFVYLYQALERVPPNTAQGLQRLLTAFGINNVTASNYHLEYALYTPNPFFGYKKCPDPRLPASNHLYLADGGDEGENIPFHPLLIPSRRVDLVLAYDMTSDLLNLPNGTVLQASARRYHTPSNTDLAFTVDGVSRAVFPYVPTPRDLLLINQGGKPVLLGCNVTEYPHIAIPTTNTQLPPLLLYTPNHAHTYPSNRSTFQLSYTVDEVTGMVQNGYNLATFMNSTEFAVCIKCAVLKRHFDRGHEPPAVCKECYDEYCWAPPAATYGTNFTFRNWNETSN